MKDISKHDGGVFITRRLIGGIFLVILIIEFIIAYALQLRFSDNLIIVGITFITYLILTRSNLFGKQARRNNDGSIDESSKPSTDDKT